MLPVTKVASPAAAALGAAAGAAAALCVLLAVAGAAPLASLFTAPGSVPVAMAATQRLAHPTPLALTRSTPLRTTVGGLLPEEGQAQEAVAADAAVAEEVTDDFEEVAAAEGVSSREALAFNVGSLGLLGGWLWSLARRRPQADEEKVALASTSGESGSTGKSGSFLSRIDFVLLAYFFFWYLGNYYYNIYNKVALNTCGGAAGFPMTVATGQLFFAALYPLFLWLAPDARKAPRITAADVKAMLPVSLCAAGAHCSSVFALGAGAVSFAQIVKAAEPAFAAVLGTLFYGKAISTAKWLCLVPVIGGVALASVKELDFSWAALFAAAVANLFAAVKGNENKKLMESRGIKERLGSIGNQFAVTSVLSFLLSLPLMLLREGSRFPEFLKLLAASPALRFNLIASGLVFYAYNELATMTIDKTNAVTQSVANTAKRVIVIVGVAIVLGESLDPLKLLGCAIGIGGVFLYSIIDSIIKPKPSGSAPAPQA
eukprot:EG_transcript_6976